MGNVKECPRCNKTVSSKLAFCWDCWNVHRNTKQPKYQCQVCEIDITAREHDNFTVCKHPTQDHRITQQQIEHCDYTPILTQQQDWLQLEQRNMELTLASFIDDALDEGEKEKFLELTEQLKQLKGGVLNG